MPVNGYEKVSTEGNYHMISVSRQTLTSQNSPSSYNASSLRGSKNGRLTIIPEEKNRTSSVSLHKPSRPHCCTKLPFFVA